MSAGGSGERHGRSSSRISKTTSARRFCVRPARVSFAAMKQHAPRALTLSVACQPRVGAEQVVANRQSAGEGQRFIEGQRPGVVGAADDRDLAHESRAPMARFQA
jgi:hypothetical protein